MKKFAKFLIYYVFSKKIIYLVYYLSLNIEVFFSNFFFKKKKSLTKNVNFKNNDSINFIKKFNLGKKHVDQLKNTEIINKIQFLENIFFFYFKFFK